MRWVWTIATALTALAGPAAAAPWFEARSDHFIIYAPGKAESAQDYATRLERFDKGMRVMRGLPDRPSDRDNPLYVYVLPDAAAVEQLCKSGNRRNAASCANVAGFYEPRASGSVAFTPRRSGEGSVYDLSAQTVLFHEYTHHFMYANYSAAYPGWFTEGFAEFNGTARFEKDGGIGFGIPAMHRAYGLMNSNALSLEAMLTADNRKLSAEQREGLYGRGWLLTHYLTFAPLGKPSVRKNQLSEYLAALNAGTPSLAAAKAAFGDLKTLDRDVERYLMRGTLSYLPIAKDKLPIGPITVRALTPGEAAMMPSRMRSERGVDRPTAEKLVIDARKAAAPFPNDPGAQTWLAEAEYDAGRDDLADAAVDRALAADPKAVGAMLYKGMIHLRRAAEAKTADASLWREARSWFVKANRLQPDAAEPLMLFYDSFLAAGLPPTANAVVGLKQAFDLAPQDIGLRFRVAREYLREGDRKLARLALAPLAYDPHRGPDNPAAKLIARIDTADDTALAAIAEKPDDDDSD